MKSRKITVTLGPEALYVLYPCRIIAEDPDCDSDHWPIVLTSDLVLMPNVP